MSNGQSPYLKIHSHKQVGICIIDEHVLKTSQMVGGYTASWYRHVLYIDTSI